MADELVNRLNWIDVFVLIIFLRVILLGLRKGFMIEAFKLIGTITAIFVSLHYYSNFSDFISTHTPIPSDFADFISLVLLSVLVLIIFKFFRDGLLTLIKVNPLEVLDRWGSIALSLARGIFAASLIILIIFLSTIGYFRESVESSFSNRFLLEISPRTYAFIFENLFSKFSPKEKLNLTVFKALEKRG